MVKASMPAMETIQSAAITNAKILKRESEIGQIKKGFFTDVVAVDENPIKKISTMGKCDFCKKIALFYLE